MSADVWMSTAFGTFQMLPAIDPAFGTILIMPISANLERILFAVLNQSTVTFLDGDLV